jgi:hypothetical protein
MGFEIVVDALAAKEVSFLGLASRPLQYSSLDSDIEKGASSYKGMLQDTESLPLLVSLRTNRDVEYYREWNHCL